MKKLLNKIKAHIVLILLIILTIGTTYIAYKVSFNEQDYTINYLED